MIARLELENFAAFRQLRMEFSPRVNVIIGENSSGKTHLLKAAYALGKSCDDLKKNAELSFSDLATDKLLRLYKPQNNSLSRLYCRSGEGPARVRAADANDKVAEVEFSSKSKKVQAPSVPDGVSLSGVYIPTKDVLSLLPAMAEQRVSQDCLQSLFDDTILDLCFDLLHKVEDDYETELSDNPRLGTLLPVLSEAIGGRYEIAGTQQFFTKGRYEDVKSTPSSQSQQAKAYSDKSKLRFTAQSGTELCSNMTAEGYRKIGVLMQLLRNRCIEPGITGTLFWDEPECNLNPKLIRILVDALLTLSRNGLQIVVTTHDYVLLKWLDLLSVKSKDDHIRYHSIYRDAESNELRVDTCDEYSKISRSSISDTFAELYDADVKRALG